MCTYKKETARDRGDWQGMNWIRQDKRLAIYLRDGLACMYCGQGIEDGVTLTLDHVVPASKGGSNKESNLICACEKCNKSRGTRSIASFTRAVARYVGHGLTAKDLQADIKKHTSMSLKSFRAEAKKMIERRGSAARVIASM